MLVRFPLFFEEFLRVYLDYTRRVIPTYFTAVREILDVRNVEFDQINAILTDGERLINVLEAFASIPAKAHSRIDAYIAEEGILYSDGFVSLAYITRIKSFIEEFITIVVGCLSNSDASSNKKNSLIDGSLFDPARSYLTGGGIDVYLKEFWRMEDDADDEDGWGVSSNRLGMVN